MATTTNGYHYPTGPDVPDVPFWNQQLANDIEAKLNPGTVAGIPFRFAAGIASLVAPGNTATPAVVVTLPVGRFSQSPIVTATLTGTGTYFAYTASVTAANFNIGMVHNTAGTNVAAATYSIHWTAVQMLTTGGAG